MELQPGTHITDKLRLVRRLRQGAMGELWVAEHTTLKTEVAVKLILDEATERFGDLEQRFALEAEATAKVHSPHVVRIFDCGQTKDGAAYIVMELLEGESLQEHIERSGPFGPTEVGEILRQAGRALDAAHAVGIVHRDVKPQNIFLSYMHGEPHIKMVDFGSAKHLGPRQERPQTAPDLVVGTPAYVSPDQLANPGTVDFRTDLWALGVTVYKCLTGELPFRGDDMVETCNAILEGKLYAPSRARPSLGKVYDAWFVRVFHPDRSLRPQSGGEMAQSFAALERRSVAARSVKRHMLASVTATGIATALATVVVLATLGGPRGPGPVQEARATLDRTVATGAPGSAAPAGARAPATGSTPSAAAPLGPSVAPAGV
ncbi:MAG: serine/threonine protein kinase, partial [Myxococcales bacterium]|nr:serine/threonine protein kinase [Myxococcales bacterium]